jgi:hypothetical protein
MASPPGWLRLCFQFNLQLLEIRPAAERVQVRVLLHLLHVPACTRSGSPGSPVSRAKSSYEASAPSVDPTEARKPLRSDPLAQAASPFISGIAE